MLVVGVSAHFDGPTRSNSQRRGRVVEASPLVDKVDVDISGSLESEEATLVVGMFVKGNTRERRGESRFWCWFRCRFRSRFWNWLPIPLRSWFGRRLRSEFTVVLDLTTELGADLVDLLSVDGRGNKGDSDEELGDELHGGLDGEIRK